MARFLITGGCGFVGCNLADRLLRDDHRVVLFDNLSRPGSDRNLEWLVGNHAGKITFIKGDVRDSSYLEYAMKKKHAAVFHAAGMVPDPSSTLGGQEGFEINARGTLNVLDAIRKTRDNSSFVLMSSVCAADSSPDRPSSQPTDDSLVNSSKEVVEARSLDTNSPYGRWMAAAEQYVRSYSRSFALRTVILRLGSPYGIRQRGDAEHEWVARCVIAAHFGREVIDCGDPNQLRDMLYIDDLVEAAYLAFQRIDDVQGETFTISGGATNAMSPLELAGELEQITGTNLCFSKPCRHDQLGRVANIYRARKSLAWEPTVSASFGVRKFYNWIRSNEHLLDSTVEHKRAA